MLFHRAGVSRVESAYDICGPCTTGAMATTAAAYPTALFLSPINETTTTSVGVVVDMAKWADGTTRVSWLRGGVYMRMKPTQNCHVRQRFDTSGGGAMTTSTGHALVANQEAEKIFDEDFRYLEYIWDSTTGTLTHWAEQIPQAPIALSDT